MAVLGKLRPTEDTAARSASPSHGTSTNLRRSNGLKDFLWLMPEVDLGRLLDLGPVAQSTVTFFTDRGFRITTEDLLRTWAEFHGELKSQSLKGAAGEEPDPAVIAAKFLEKNFQFGSESFHGILAWDVFDFLETELLVPLAGRLHSLLAPGGVLLAEFRDSMEVAPVNYRIRDHETMDLVPVRRSQSVLRVFQNREILALFSDFRSSRTYVGRDHLREALFLK